MRSSAIWQWPRARLPVILAQRTIERTVEGVAGVPRKEEQKVAEAKFKQIGEAFEVLTDNRKRELWDEGYDLKSINERVEMEKQQRAGGGGHSGGG